MGSLNELDAYKTNPFNTKYDIKYHIPGYINL